MSKIKKLPIDVIDLGLTPGQLKFLGEYCTNGFDAGEAYKESYKRYTATMTPEELRVEGVLIANSREMKIAVQRYVNSVIDPYRDTTEAELLQIYRSRAMYDPNNYIDKDGNAKPLDQIERTHRYAIDGYKKSYYGRNADREVREITFANRTQALKQLEEFLNKGKSDDTTAVPDDTKKRLKDIFAGVDKGIKIASDLNIIKQTERNTIEFTESDVVDTTVEVPLPDNEPVLIAARKVAEMETSGVLVENNPIVLNARAYVADLKKKKEARRNGES